MTRDKLIADLCKLLESQWVMVLTKLAVQLTIFSTEQSPLATRVAELITWADQDQTGGRIRDIERVYKEVMWQTSPRPRPRNRLHTFVTILGIVVVVVGGSIVGYRQCQPKEKEAVPAASASSTLPMAPPPRREIPPVLGRVCKEPEENNPLVCCIGALMTPQRVVTTWGCADDIPGKINYVALSDNKGDPERYVASIDEVVLSNRFRLGILILEKPVTTVQPLPCDNSDVNELNAGEVPWFTDKIAFTRSEGSVVTRSDPLFGVAGLPTGLPSGAPFLRDTSPGWALAGVYSGERLDDGYPTFYSVHDVCSKIR